MSVFTQRGMSLIVDFLSAVSATEFTNSIFRGHSAVGWHLTPSAYRKDQGGVDSVDRLKEWKRRSARFIPVRPQSELEWLILAQHFGVSTPLLDWTSNPLIALFFACQSVRQEDGEVIQVSRKNLKVLSRPETVDVFQNRQAPVLIDASFMNSRSIAQDGLVTLHSLGCKGMAEASISASYPVRYVDKALIIEALRALGFDEDRMFADLATVARTFASWLEIDHLLS